MKKYIPLLFIFCFLASCAQDSIFYNISMEPEPRDPIIPGTPVNIVVYQNRMYTGSFLGQRIYSFPNEEERWSPWSSPGGSLGGLASDGDNLYALVFPRGDPLTASEIKIFRDGTWENVTKHGDVLPYSIQSIYGAGDRIFAGAQIRHTNSVEYAILQIVKNGDQRELRVLLENTSLLTGAAWRGENSYLLSTAGHGIYNFGLASIDGPVLPPFLLPETINTVVSGIIQIPEGPTVAVSNTGSGRGNIIIIESNDTITTLATEGFNYTGGLALWRNHDDHTAPPSLLLLGVRNRGFSLAHGYREMTLGAGGIPVPGLRIPGNETISSVEDRPRYSASIGTHPVNHLIQVPHSVIPWSADTVPIIFAGTSIRGLWSYREGQWNAED